MDLPDHPQQPSPEPAPVPASPPFSAPPSVPEAVSAPVPVPGATVFPGAAPASESPESGMPTMADLRSVSTDLDGIDEILARLDNENDADAGTDDAVVTGAGETATSGEAATSR